MLNQSFHRRAPRIIATPSSSVDLAGRGVRRVIVGGRTMLMPALLNTNAPVVKALNQEGQGVKTGKSLHSKLSRRFANLSMM